MFLPPFGTCCVGEEAAIAAPDNSKQNNAAKSPQEMFLFCVQAYATSHHVNTLKAARIPEAGRENAAGMA